MEKLVLLFIITTCFMSLASVNSLQAAGYISSTSIMLNNIGYSQSGRFFVIIDETVEGTPPACAIQKNRFAGY